MTAFPKTKMFVTALLVFVLTACGGEQARKLPYLDQDAVILAFGDSLTYGSGAKPEQAFPSVLEELINRRVISVATPGDNTSEGLVKLPGALAEHEPDLVILCLGGNDFLRKLPEAETLSNLRQMIEMVHAANSPVLLLGVPKPGIFGLDGHPLYETLAEEYDLVLDNTTIPEILSEHELKADAIHPNASGYLKLAEAIAELLREVGAV